MCAVAPRVPNFRPFHSTISRIQDIAHFMIFPFTPMLKFQSATKSADHQFSTVFNSIWQIAKTYITSFIYILLWLPY